MKCFDLSREKEVAKPLHQADAERIVLRTHHSSAHPRAYTTLSENQPSLQAYHPTSSRGKLHARASGNLPGMRLFRRAGGAVLAAPRAFPWKFLY